MIDIDNATIEELRAEIKALHRDRDVIRAAREAGALQPEQFVPWGRDSDEEPKALVESM